ncbi:hypothetical protein IY972_06370 [Campylobacter volucris]|uniref:hypothetical protein n=1 Tax=Campylobacter volucris TaxID=1031542 RepID=UPI00189FF0C5|nr:hypothetical protein [Campylobacter volucris]MBF7060519.1 hypothetical protein [Campylobacter volucris]
MILEIHSYDKELFLTLGIEKHSQIAFAAKKTNIEIIHNGVTHQIKTNKEFGVLLNVICIIRERIDESLEENDESLVIDIDEIIENTCKELE